jgi:Zn-dependent oligopeptidase
MSKEKGREFRRFILEPGSTKECMQMLKDFLGREPDGRAFRKELGLDEEVK